MYRKPLLLYGVLFLAIWAFLSACTQSEAPQSLNRGANPDLSAHTAEFKREVIKVTDGVYVAVGFGLANSILLVGEDGVIIIDTMESAEAAEAVKAEFLKISSKPVKAIIYTHYHSDHTFGAKTMAGKHNPAVYAHASTSTYLNRVANITRETTYRRAMRQFGVLLPEGAVLNAGIGPFLKFDADSTVAILPPTHCSPKINWSWNLPESNCFWFMHPGKPTIKFLFGSRKSACCSRLTISTNHFPIFTPFAAHPIGM